MSAAEFRWKSSASSSVLRVCRAGVESVQMHVCASDCLQTGAFCLWEVSVASREYTETILQVVQVSRCHRPSSVPSRYQLPTGQADC